jgi:hypothetical protein
MAVDQVLVMHILGVLAAVGDRGFSIDALAAETEIRADRSLSVQQCQHALTAAETLGWVQSRTDEWGQPRWFLTTSGANRQARQ